MFYPGSIKRSAALSCLTRAAAAAVVFCAAVNMFSFAADCRGVRQKVLRLHIIANSDMLCDQEVKTAVRDGILALSEDIFAGCAEFDGAAAEAERRLCLFEEAAQELLRQRGFDYGAKARLCRDVFPTRRYGDIILPAGEYTAVRIELGKAEGHNWWCVMFPMLCVPSSGDTGVEDVLNKGERRVIETDGRDLRFKCAELWEKYK